MKIAPEFGTTTPDLLALLDWLVALSVTEVLVESIGVFCSNSAGDSIPIQE